LAEQGFDILFSCRNRVCGGFDFRHALDLGPSPEMHVDLGNFAYVSAVAGDTDRAVAITVSRGGALLYVHAVEIASGPPAADAPAAAAAGAAQAGPRADATPAPGDVIARLAQDGSATLEDLRFGTGASELSGRDYESLRRIAAYLAQNPNRRIVLVGHTDAEGGLDGNIALSRARAEAVRRHLVDALGVDPNRVTATGIGYLAPRATNDTPEGRAANRRVEAVLLGTD
jgi:OOP family OmpA-OmpF porin